MPLRLHSTSFSMYCTTQGSTGMGQVFTFVHLCKVVEYCVSENVTSEHILGSPLTMSLPWVNPSPSTLTHPDAAVIVRSGPVQGAETHPESLTLHPDAAVIVRPRTHIRNPSPSTLTRQSSSDPAPCRAQNTHPEPLTLHPDSP